MAAASAVTMISFEECRVISGDVTREKLLSRCSYDRLLETYCTRPKGFQRSLTRRLWRMSVVMAKKAYLNIGKGGNFPNK